MTAFQIRQANSTDLPAINAVLRAAFPTDLEARLVALLISHYKDAVSLVACMEERIVGHILFSPATCDGPTGRSEGLGLAPLAVAPEFQRRGIGAALIRAGLEECRQLGTPWLVVLGEPAYYSRFGFEPASHYGITGEFGGGDAFQHLILDNTRQPPTGAHIKYAPEFHNLLVAE